MGGRGLIGQADVVRQIKFSINSIIRESSIQDSITV